MNDYSDHVEVAIAVNHDLAEGPFWDEVSGKLIFVDGYKGAVHRFDNETGDIASLFVDEPIGAAIPASNERLVFTSANGLKEVFKNKKKSLIVEIETDQPNNRLNDAKCDSMGRLWTGSFSEKFEQGAGNLYRIDPNNNVKKIASGFRVSNGIAWNSEETKMYFVDTLSGIINLFDYDLVSGEVFNRRIFVEIDRSNGLPDGLTVDEFGDVWVALFHGGQVRHYKPDGQLAGVIKLPVSRVTSCIFGGKDFRDLFITTADFKSHKDGKPHEEKAGYVFRCRLGRKGLPSYKFAG